MNKKNLISLILLISICASLCSCQQKISTIRQTSLAIGTIVDITVFDKKDKKALENAIQKISYYDTIFNSHIENSEVSSFNQSNANEIFKMSDDLNAVVSKALKYCEISNGKFDISIYPVSHLWDFASSEPHVPEQYNLTSALDYVSYKNITYNPAAKSITKAYNQCAIDLGGIAKGYIADQLVSYFKEAGVQKAIINLGGNVYAIGSKSKDNDWTIGIQKPFENVGTVLGTIKIKNQAVVTSGIYERQFIEKNKVYHHILDSKTGYPYNNELSGVSIICTSATDADVLSTVIYMMGSKDGLNYIETLPNTEAIFITRNKKIILSSGLVDNFQCLDDSFSLVCTPK